MIRAVLFDMDGLAFDSEAFYKGIWQDEAARLGYDLHDDLYRHLLGVPNAVCEQRLVEWFPDFPLEEFRVTWKARRDALRAAEGIAVKPGAVELVTWLDEQGVPLALATSSSSSDRWRATEHMPRSCFVFRPS